MGDGSLVEMTRSEIKADLEEGTQLAAKRAKVDPLTQDELDHLLDIYASSARFTAVDIGDEVVMSNDGTGTKHIGNRVQDLQTYEQVVGIDMVELWQIDYSYKAVKTNVAHEGQYHEDRPDALHQPRAVRGDARPRPLLQARRAHRQLVRAAAADEGRRGARRAARGLRHAGRRHQLRRRPHDRGRRRRHRHGHHRRGRRRRLPRRPHRLPHAAREVPLPRHRDRHGERVRARHARPARPSTASVWPACGPKTSCAWCRPPGPPSTGPPSTSTPASRRLEHRPGDDLHQAGRRDRRDPGARQRGHGRRRRADLRLPAGRRRPHGLARRSSRSSRSTATRWARAIPWAWSLPTRRLRAWAECAPREISWHACR